MTETAALTKPQKQGITTAILGMASAAMGFGFAAPVLSQHLERMTASGALLGLLISVGAVTSILMTPFIPRLLSRFSGRSAMIWSLIIGAAGFPLYKLFMVPEAWFAIRFMQGCAFTLMFVTAETWINQLAPETSRGRILGLYGTALAGGFGLGSALAAFTGIEGWRPFVVGTGLSLCGLIPFIIWRISTAIVPPDREHSGVKAMLNIARAAPTLLTCGVVFGAIEQTVIHALPVYGTRLGFSEYSGRILLLIALLGNFLFQYPMGMLADKVDRSKLLFTLMGVAFAAPILIVLAGSEFILLAPLLFIYLGLGTALYTVGLVLLAERFKGTRIAAANAAFIFAYGVGSLIVPPLGGILMDIIEPYGLMWALAGIGGLGLLVLVARRAKTQQNS